MLLGCGNSGHHEGGGGNGFGFECFHGVMMGLKDAIEGVLGVEGSDFLRDWVPTCLQLLLYFVTG